MNYNAEMIDDIIDAHDTMVSGLEARQSISLARIAKDQHDQVEEALSIIKDLSYFYAFNYVPFKLPEGELEAIYERISVLRLAQ
jgi:hypothetical protein